MSVSSTMSPDKYLIDPGEESKESKESELSESIVIPNSTLPGFVPQLDSEDDNNDNDRPANGAATSPLITGRIVNSDLQESELTADEESMFRRLFGNLDRKMEGSIEIDELLNACRLLQLGVGDTEISEIFKVIDDDDGEVSVDEFLRFMRIIKWQSQRKKRWVADGTRLQKAVQRILEDRKDLDRHVRLRRKQLISEAMGNMSGTRKKWLFDAILLLVCFYYGISVPLFDVSGIAVYEGNITMISIELVLTLFCWVDIAINLVHPYTHGGKIISDKKLTMKRYLRSKRFAIDISSSLPLDLIFYAADVSELYFLCYHLRLIKLLKVSGLFMNFTPGTPITRGTVKYIYGWVPLIRNILWAVLFVHSSSCAFLLASGNFSRDCMWCKSRRPSWTEYRTALYRSLYTISSVGYGDVPVEEDAEYYLCIFLFLVSIMVNGWLVGKMTSYMMLDPDGEHKKLIRLTLQVISHFHLPEDIIEDILSLQDHLLVHKTSLQSFQEVIGCMPTTVQESLSLYIRVNHMNKVELFQSVSAECKVALAEALERRIVPRDEIFIRDKEVGNTMYFIVHGFVEVLKDGVHISTLMQGSVVGEVSLLRPNVLRTATIRTLTYCEMLELSRENFEPIIERFPTLRWHLEVVIARRQNKPLPPLTIQSLAPLIASRKKPRKDADLSSAVLQHLQKKKQFEGSGSIDILIEPSDVGGISQRAAQHRPSRMSFIRKDPRKSCVPSSISPRGMKKKSMVDVVVESIPTSPQDSFVESPTRRLLAEAENGGLRVPDGKDGNSSRGKSIFNVAKLDSTKKHNISEPAEDPAETSVEDDANGSLAKGSRGKSCFNVRKLDIKKPPSVHFGQDEPSKEPSKEGAGSAVLDAIRDLEKMVVDRLRNVESAVDGVLYNQRVLSRHLERSSRVVGFGDA
eukprot:Sspe_Gene.86031::Locus_56771_Transcript_1_1_Confidence_1.000_Length_3048::g.86031::m.86031